MLHEMVKDGISLFQRSSGNFIAHAQDHLAAIGPAVDAADADDLMATAHKLKGSALNLGLPRVGLAASELEERGRARRARRVGRARTPRWRARWAWRSRRSRERAQRAPDGAVLRRGVDFWVTRRRRATLSTTARATPAARPAATHPVAPRQKAVTPCPARPVDVFELGAEHEQVVFANDPASGLRAIIAIHSTALGPALGGTRFYPYASTDDAVRDVLNLSRGMSYKAALAGLDLGGGKAVIIGDPATPKTEALLRAYGRFVQSLNGRYYTACDVGTYSEDMDHIARECDYVTGPHRRPRRRRRQLGAHGVRRLPGHARRRRGGRGASRRWPAAPSGRRRRQGRPPPGAPPRRGRRRRRRHRRRTSPRSSGCVAELPAASGRSPTPTRWWRAELDVYAPCALGGALTDEVVETLSARIVCGAANNQLAHPGDREGARGARHPLRARLLRELRRPDPGRRRARGLLVRAGPAARERDLRHHPRRSSQLARTRRRCRRRSPPTGSPSSGCARSAGSAASGSSG